MIKKNVFTVLTEEAHILPAKLNVSELKMSWELKQFMTNTTVSYELKTCGNGAIIAVLENALNIYFYGPLKKTSYLLYDIPFIIIYSRILKVLFWLISFLWSLVWIAKCTLSRGLIFPQNYNVSENIF